MFPKHKIKTEEVEIEMCGDCMEELKSIVVPPFRHLFECSCGHWQMARWREIDAKGIHYKLVTPRVLLDYLKDESPPA